MEQEELNKIARRDDVSPKEGEDKYGDVEFADQANKKYPIDTKEHVLSALRYIGQQKNRDEYSDKDLQTIIARIYTAAHKFGIDVETKKSVKFSFFTDLTKTYEEDGKHYLEGAASGVSRDQDDEVMAASAIKAMQKSIEDGIVANDGSLIQVPLLDTHRGDGVLMQLGEIVKSEITPENTLHIKAELDTDNPASVSLIKQIAKGRSYGLSVSGVINRAEKTWDEQLQRNIRMFTDVSLEHVAVTTCPSWSPSMGTVLAKSVKEYFTSEDAEASEEEPTLTMKNDNLLETSQAEVTPETKPLETVSETTSVEVEEETTKSTDPVTAEGENVEKAKKGTVTRAHFALMAKKAQHMAGHFNELASGQSHPNDELPHLQAHAKDFAKSTTALLNGDTDALDDMLGDDDNQSTALYLSEKNIMDDTKVTKSDAEVKVEEAKVETSEVKEVKADETQADETKGEETAKAATPTTPDFADMIQKAVEAATKPLLEKVDTLSKELETVKNAPVGGPKGVVKAVEEVDTSRVIEKAAPQNAQMSLAQTREMIEKAKKENPYERPEKIAYRIINGLDAFGNPRQ